MGRKGSSIGRFVRLFCGVCLLLLGIASIVAGGLVLFENSTAPTTNGYTMSNVYEVRSDAYCYFQGFLSNDGKVKWSEKFWAIESINPEHDLFVGWARSDDIGTYLTGFMFEAPESWNWNYIPYKASISMGVMKVFNNGSGPPPLPSDQDFWIDSMTIKSGERGEIEWNDRWTPEGERRVLVMMNTDASAGIQADMSFGGKIMVLEWVPYPLVFVGLVLAICGIVLIISGRKR